MGTCGQSGPGRVFWSRAVIFVTVGNTDPFDRLVQTVDQWALTQSPPKDIFAQIGAGRFVPSAFPAERFLDPFVFKSRFEEAELVISHAGMGTIITALELGKPLLVMPKRASLGEQRNEHQLATVEHVCRKYSICVAHNEQEFPHVIDRLLESIGEKEKDNALALQTNGIAVNSSLLDFVQGFLHQRAPVFVHGTEEVKVKPR